MSTLKDAHNVNVYFGNINPKESEMKEGFSIKHARAVDIAKNRFSAGYPLDWEEGEEKTLENIKQKWIKKYREERENPIRPKPVHRLAEDVEAGDIIVISPFGKDDSMRMIGVFTDEPLKYGGKLEESTNTINYRTVEDWKIIDLDQHNFSEEFGELYAQQVFEQKDVSQEDLMELLEIFSS